MSRRRWVALGAVLAAVLAAAVASHLVLRDRDRQPVADDASPQQVVQAYLDALRTHDCTTTRDLSIGINRMYSNWWCRDLASISVIAIRNPIKEDPATTGHAASDEVVYVPVQFHLRWRPGLDDPTVEDITDHWGYILVRSSPEDPWRISDQGVG